MLSAIVALGFLMTAAAWLGRQRLMVPVKSRSIPFARPTQPNAFQPPYLTTMPRTSPLRAMLWQQWRQVAVYSITILAVNLVLAIIYATADRGQARYLLLVEFAPLVAILSFGWLGCLAFYGDGVRRQCSYFADRGISPSLVWLTRILTMLVFALLMSGVWWWSFRSRGINLEGDRYLSVCLILMFCAGQMVAMWLRRPTLSFFASPVYGWVTIFFSSMLILQYYHEYWWTMLLVAPILLIATWRLTPRWLDGRIDTRFHWRAAAYSLLAILIPCLIIFANRWATTPRKLAQWRAEMMSHYKDVLEAQGPGVEVMPQVRIYYSGSSTFFDVTDAQRFRESLEDELKELRTVGSPRIGAFANASDIYAYLDNIDQPGGVAKTTLPPDTPTLAVKVLLHWARFIRTECAAGRLDLHTLGIAAEPAEQTAVQYLNRLRLNDDVPDEMAELVKLIPDSDLRKASRRQALIREWHRFTDMLAQHKKDSREATMIDFADIPTIGNTVLPFEKRRASRYVDLAVERTLDYLDSPLWPESSPELTELSKLWHEGLSGPATGTGNDVAFNPDMPIPWLSVWTSNHEENISSLREAFPAVSPVE